ncbi:MAG: hypothetical protein KF752_08100 [Pirellulaceae bacterium]|nr:hypothetical protein [Pirellulaceae bacterium]
MTKKMSLSVLVLWVIFHQPALAGHNSEFFDFDVHRGYFFPEAYGSTAGGNVFLGPYAAGTVSLGLMDVLPALNLRTSMLDTTDRLFLLNFDLVFPTVFPLPGSADQFTVRANDEVIFQRPLLDLVTVGRRNIQADFVLRYQPEIDPDTSDRLPFDLWLRFTKTGSSSTWGLDNVSLNWGQPVPEPGSAALVLLPLTIILRCRRRNVTA